MVISQKRTVLFPALLAVLMAAFPAAAQYAGVPGDIPPVPDSYRLDVVVTPPCSSVFSIPDITGIEVKLIENSAMDEIIYKRDGVTITRIENPEDQCDFAYLFTGEWGLNYQEFFNAVCISQLSPSGRYYAVGGDGTGTSRGPIYVIDLETGMKYCTTTSSVWDCSDWIEGDYLLIECAGRSESALDMWRQGDIENIPWLNISWMTEAQGSSNNIVLYHDGSSWMILPEDRYYNYRNSGESGLYENGIFFDVAASPNVIPSIAGIRSTSDFYEWIDSVGRSDTGFLNFDFRIYVDTSTNSVSDIVQIDPAM